MLQFDRVIEGRIMTFEEEAAYALASWGRFDAAVSDELLRAVTSAFALVAVADGDLAKSEIDRFVGLLKERSDVLDPLDIDQVERRFRDICGALLTNPPVGRRRALDYIAAVARSAVDCELVRGAAEIALAADNRALAAEQALLGEICAAMNIEPR